MPITRIDERPRKNGDVSWRVRFEKGYDADGKRMQDSATFRTKAEADELVKKLNGLRQYSKTQIKEQMREFLRSAINDTSFWEALNEFIQEQEDVF